MGKCGAPSRVAGKGMAGCRASAGLYGGKCLKLRPPMKQQFRGSRFELSQELPRLDE